LVADPIKSKLALPLGMISIAGSIGLAHLYIQLPVSCESETNIWFEIPSHHIVAEIELKVNSHMSRGAFQFLAIPPGERFTLSVQPDLWQKINAWENRG
jgi:hypothetical protein